MRYLSRFSDCVEKDFRQYLLRKDLLSRERIRFTAIYLNAQQRICIEELCTIFSVSRNTVCNWFNAYESGGFEALLDAQMAHSKSSLEYFDERVILDTTKQNAQNLKLILP